MAFNKYNLVLASQSPRRQQLLHELGLDFSIEVRSVDEVFPESLQAEEIALYLANLKADAFLSDLTHDKLIITADTIVWVNQQQLGKPLDVEDARRMLKMLSGNSHHVYTGVCLLTKQKRHAFYASTEVTFRSLADAEIDYYLEHFKPFDKAGAYGIQEWIGYVGVEKINGSYFNVMGLPVQKLYMELLQF